MNSGIFNVLKCQIRECKHTHIFYSMKFFLSIHNFDFFAKNSYYSQLIWRAVIKHCMEECYGSVSGKNGFGIGNQRKI